MPALAPVPKVVRIRFIGTDAANVDVGSSVFFQYGGTAPTGALLATFNTAIGGTWATNFGPYVDTGYTLTKIITTDLSSASSAQAETTMSHAGTRAGTALPLSTCLSLQIPTALRRRGGHWHVQLRCGVQADTANVQQWTTTFTGAAVNAFLLWLESIQNDVWSGGASLTLGGVQYFGPPNRTVTSSTGRVRTVSTPLAAPIFWPQTAALYANQRLGSQRRRLGKGA